MQASKQWRWFYQPEQQLKIILDNDLEHVAPFKASRLVPLQPMDEAFSTEDALHFQKFYEGLAEYPFLAAELRFQASLNHVIYQRFGRPQMPQSWYFQCAEPTLAEIPEIASLVNLNSGLENALCAVCGDTDEFVECMVLSKSFALSEIKTLAQFDVIKVMPNRLQALNTAGQLPTMDLRQA